MKNTISIKNYLPSDPPSMLYSDPLAIPLSIYTERGRERDNYLTGRQSVTTEHSLGRSQVWLVVKSAPPIGAKAV